MIIALLNGVLDENHPVFDRYLTELENFLEKQAHPTKILRLRDLEARYCTGCWSC